MVRSSKVPGKYYAVAKGKVPGIYNSWGECFAQVNGFSGNLYQSFVSHEEAWGFLQSNRDPPVNPPPVQPLGVLPQPVVAPSVPVLVPDLSRGRVIGSDKSLGKDSELFGIPIQSESLLQESLTPRNLSPAAQTAFAEGTPDGVSQPGAYFVSDADDQASTLTLSVASLATQNTDNKRLGRPTDFLWKQDRRTTLKYGVTSMETLKIRLDTLEEEMDKFLSHAAMSRSCPGRVAVGSGGGMVDDLPALSYWAGYSSALHFTSPAPVFGGLGGFVGSCQDRIGTARV
eukprot:scaffold72253_cov64-Attheya_sp.AAC.1